MGNNQCVPRLGGEPVADYLRRMFKDKTNNADKLVYHALKEEHKRRNKDEERKGVWKKIKKKMKTGRHDNRSDEDLLEAFKPQENEFTEVRRLHENSTTKRENAKSNNPYCLSDFEKWRSHQENVITSIRATMAERREGSILCQNGTISPMNPYTPRNFLCRGNSPIFQYHSTPRFDWRKTKSNRRSVRDMSGDTSAPWTHVDYGSEQLGEESVDHYREYNVDSWCNEDSELTPEDSFDDWIEPEDNCTRYADNHDDNWAGYDKWDDDNENNDDGDAKFNKKTLCDDHGELDIPEVLFEDDFPEIEESFPSELEYDKTPYLNTVKHQAGADCSSTSAPQRCKRRNPDNEIKHQELKKERCSDDCKKTSFAKKIHGVFKSAFSFSTSDGAGDVKRDKTKDEERNVGKRFMKGNNNKIEVSEAKPESRKAEAFFISFSSSPSNGQNEAKTVKMGYAKRFNDKIKQTTDAAKLDEEPIRKAEALFIPAFGPSDSELDECTNSMSLQDRTFTRKKKAQYGSVEHFNKIKTDDEIRKNRLEKIQTKVDSWKTNETNDSYLHSGLRAFEPAPKVAQYGSVAHNNLIKKDNEMTKKKIENATTKVDSWKKKEEDDSYLCPNMRKYTLAPKPAQYGSVEHNNQIKGDNHMRKKKLDSIHTTLDTWKTKEPDYSYLQPKMRSYDLAPKQAEYGSVEHNNQIKKNNALRKTRLSKIHTTLDTWNTPNPGSRYSLQRKDEWEPVLDHKKYGTAAHFHQIKSDNALRKRRIGNVQSGLDTWNSSNPGSKYSLQRKDEWEPVYDTRKYGSVAHYHQVRETHVENRYMINNASTRMNTWQSKSKMKLLHASNQKTIETTNPNMKHLKASLIDARPRIDTGRNNPRSADHNLSSWSRHVTDGPTSNRSLPGTRETTACRYREMPSRLPRPYHQ